MSYILLGLPQFIIAATFLGSILILLRDIIKPKYVTSDAWNLYFLISHYKPVSYNVVNGVLTATLVITVLKIKIRQNADLVVNN